MGDNLLLTFGLVFIVIGIAFEFGAAPLHMWIPDVYHGAPMPITLLLSSVPKLAAVALAIRLLDNGMISLHADRSEEHTSELQSRGHLVCRLLLEKKKPD